MEILLLHIKARFEDIIIIIMSTKRKIESSSDLSEKEQRNSEKEQKKETQFSEIDKQINTQRLSCDEPVKEGYAAKTIEEFIRKMHITESALAAEETTILMTWCEFTPETTAVRFPSSIDNPVAILCS